MSNAQDTPKGGLLSAFRALLSSKVNSWQSLADISQTFTTLSARVINLEQRVYGLELENKTLRDKVLRKIQKAEAAQSEPSVMTDPPTKPWWQYTNAAPKSR